MRRGIALLTALLALTAVTAVPAATSDLGEGLHYVRAADLSSLPEAPPADPLVLDLRRTRGGDLARLAALLRTEGPVRFVLLGKETAGEVRALLASRAPAVITVAAGGPDAAADVVLDATSPEEDLRAYEAHENGTDLALLIQPPVKKNRRDEASILRERTNGNGSGQGRAAASEDPPPEAAGGEPEESPLVDAVLQRAVQLHRGLKALGRL
jgi:hypothetical protein